MQTSPLSNEERLLNQGHHVGEYIHARLPPDQRESPLADGEWAWSDTDKEKQEVVTSVYQGFYKYWINSSSDKLPRRVPLQVTAQPGRRAPPAFLLWKHAGRPDYRYQGIQQHAPPPIASLQQG